MIPTYLQCSHLASLLIAEADSFDVAEKHICDYDGKIMVRWSGHTEIAHTIFFDVTPIHLQEGLTGEEWATLADRLETYLTKDPQLSLIEPLIRKEVFNVD